MFFPLLLLLCQIEIKAFDTPDDDGSSITVTWQKDTSFLKIEVLRSLNPDTGFEKIYETNGRDTLLLDNPVPTNLDYYYKISGLGANTETTSEVVGPVRARPQVFNASRINILICIIVLFAAIVYYISRARKGQKLFVRRIPALTAIDEAIGRATEMGKPVLYVPGIMGIDEPETIASMSILSHVAERTAQYGSTLYVPTSNAMTMSMAYQVVKESATRVGRPDWFNADNIRYITDEQFAYVSAVDGIMVREKPATNFYLGKFYAESLILAETGHSTGAFQIAGTALPDQLPFFVAACDYTLIGEELYAASAYLSQEPVQLGSLKGQDFGKFIFIIIILVGVVLQLFGWGFFYHWFTAQ